MNQRIKAKTITRTGGCGGCAKRRAERAQKAALAQKNAGSSNYKQDPRPNPRLEAKELPKTKTILRKFKK